MVYYRNRVFGGARDGVILGLLPVAAAAFLARIVVKSPLAAPAAQLWSLVGIIGVGLVLMLIARFVLASSFFGLRRESEPAAR